MFVLNEKIISKFIASLNVFKSTAHSYHKGISYFASYLYEHEVITPSHENIIEFSEALINTGKKPATVALYLSAVRRFFDWTANKGLYPNIAINVKSPQVSKEFRRDCLSEDQIITMLSNVECDSLEGLRNYAILVLMVTTGLRTIEVTRANVEDIRLNAGQPVLYVQGKGKSSKADFVKLTPKVFTAIRNYLQARGNVKPEAPLFVSHSKRNSGQRLTTMTVSSVCKKAMVAAGFISSRLTAHSLRHSAATLSLLNGADLGEVKALLRHENIADTLLYAHNFNNEADELSSHCEELISEAIFS